ncbi:hypothetical protein TSUD_387720 [Trifolium subterraneum]|uniref:C3H1-type domain-containing protein n=1 Tax=Trifolium subterraneum TaxID=3900 RepID=A0A2Z6NJJ2_TRISU|nr:hypothetical protein TSUD_387720 [Trifolium subterraneum]
MALLLQPPEVAILVLLLAPDEVVLHLKLGGDLGLAAGAGGGGLAPQVGKSRYACWRAITYRRCRYYPCKFRHDICRNWVAGRCLAGDSCLLAHGAADRCPEWADFYQG